MINVFGDNVHILKYNKDGKCIYFTTIKFLNFYSCLAKYSVLRISFLFCFAVIFVLVVFWGDDL